MTTPEENRNILDLEELEVPYESGQLYIVHNSRDFRISVLTLLSLISKEKVGLDKVDNTADKDKPVSDPTRQAIDESISGVIGREEFDNFVERVQGNVTQEALDQVIARIMLVLDSKLDQAQTTNMIALALTPIQDEIMLLGQSMENALQRVAALESSNFVTQTQLNSAVSSVGAATDQKVNSLRVELSNVIGLLSQSVDARILLITQNINAINASLANKSDRNHQHNTDSIVDFEVEVKRLIEESGRLDILLGRIEW